MRNIYFFFSFAMMFFGSYSLSYGQNNLAPGDIAIASYQSDLDLTNNAYPGQTSNFDDRFSIVILKNGGIAAGTTLYFTDNGWNGTTNDFMAAGTEGFIKWVAPAGGVTQGTEIFFIATYADLTETDTWNAYTAEGGITILGTTTSETPQSMAFAVAGDQLLIYQTGTPAGAPAAYNNTTRRFITALSANIVPNVTTFAGWDGASPGDANSSSVPPGLTNGITAFLMSPGPLPAAATSGTLEPDNGKYTCVNSNGVACNAIDLSTKIYTSANWGYNNAAFAIGATSSHCTYSLSAPAVITSQPTPVTICAPEVAAFTAAATGATSYQWQESATTDFTSAVTLTNSGVYSGANTPSLSISNTTGLGGYYYRLVAISCNNPVYSNAALLTATASTLPTNSMVNSHAADASSLYFSGSCNIISKVAPSGANAVTGSVTSKVWVEPSVPFTTGGPFVQRHYEITPATNASVATGTVTLYFSQAEFTAFNADPGSTIDLPSGPADNLGKSNLRIGKFSGTSSNGTGLPTSYSSTNSLIDPADENIIWNAVANRWEVTFDVTGFSGFVVQTVLGVLPVNLLSFNAERIANDIRVKWQTSLEVNNDHCEVERSIDGKTFDKVATIGGTNASSLKNYLWLDDGAALINTGTLYYRVKMVSMSGTVQYSNIIMIPLSKISAGIITLVAPNPFHDKLSINLNMPKKAAVAFKLADLMGRVLIREKTTANEGYSTHNLTSVNSLSPGVYLLTAEYEGKKLTYKVIKQ